jgi:hypothetical protein
MVFGKMLKVRKKNLLADSLSISDVKWLDMSKKIALTDLIGCYAIFAVFFF